MEPNTQPVTHILRHLTKGISTEPLVAFKSYNEDLDQYDHCLLLITPSNALSLCLDREQANDLIEALRGAFELDGGRNDQCALKQACYKLPSLIVESASLKSKERKRRKAKTAG